MRRTGTQVQARDRTGASAGPGGRRRGARGFTALELLIALVLLALVATVVWPGVSRVRARWAVAGARDAFAAWHARARWTALAHGRLVQLRVRGDDTGGRVELWKVGIDPLAPAPALDDVLDLALEFPGVRLESNREVLCFGARGLPVGGTGCDLPNATIVFRMGAVAETATVSLAGRLLKR